MPFQTMVPMLDGSEYRLTRLLSDGDSNAKLSKSDKSGRGISTVGLSLAPAMVSGFQVCSSSSHACRISCLFTSGLARMYPRMIQPSRIARTRFMKLSPQAFCDQLVKEIASAERKAMRENNTLAVRLNVISDIMWERQFPAIFNAFPNIQFYDYTKHANRYMRWLNYELPANYHLTFSWAGDNLDASMNALNNGGNVAIPFAVSYNWKSKKPLPKTWHGFEIIDGDETDLRFLDLRNCVVGLRAKGEAKNNLTDGFVVNPNAKECGR